MMGPLQNAMRLQALRAMSDQASERVGIVRNFDPNIWAVRCELQPEGNLSGWLPLTAPWVGNGWGFFAAPSIGDMVAVHFFGADLEAGFVGGRMFNDIDRPLPVPSGELWIAHVSGAFFKLTNDGKAQFSDAHGASVALNGDGTITSAGAWAHIGTLNVNGDVTTNGALKNNGKSVGSTLKVTGVSTGFGVSGVPQ